VREIRHGSELKAGDVGARIGRADLVPTAGAPVHDASAAPWVRRIERAATYDGRHTAGPHLLIEGLAIAGPLDLWARLPIVVRDCVLVAGAGHWGIHVRPGGGPVLLLHLTVEGAVSGPAGAGLFVRRDNVVAHRCHVRRFADGIRASANGLIVSECLIDDITHSAGDHNDGIQLDGAPSNVAISRCRVANRHPQTSAVKLAGRNISVEDCHLSGGGWTLYAGQRDGARDVVVARCVFAREHFARIGHFGAVTDWARDAARGFRWHNNRLEDGRALRP